MKKQYIVIYKMIKIMLFLLLDSDGLGEISGTVHIESVEVGNMVAHELERDDSEDILEAVNSLGYSDDLEDTSKVFIGDFGVSNDNWFSTSGHDLLESVKGFLKNKIM